MKNFHLIFGQPRRPETADPATERGRHFVLGDALVGRNAVVHSVNLFEKIFVDLKLKKNHVATENIVFSCIIICNYGFSV